MTLENNQKILIGSVIQSINKKVVLGETDDTAVILLSILVEQIEYALKQQESGVSRYNEIVHTLYKKVLALKNQCPDVCFYKNRLIFLENNTKPTIDDNTITIPFGATSVLPYSEVIHNYNDAENNLVSQVVVLNVGEDHEIFIDSNPVLENNLYSPSVEFSARYALKDDYTYIVKNTGTTSVVLEVLTEDLITAEANGNFVGLNEIDEEVIFQQLSTSSENLPNSTIIYIHIDTTSMQASDQRALEATTLAWWTQFQIDNPDFAGSLLINTVANTVIDPAGTAPGRGGAVPLNIIADETTFRLTGTEQWLSTPIQGLLRQAYKEGVETFTSGQAFLDYVSGRSLVVIPFVDEANSSYHGRSRDFTGEPTDIYTRDYTNFVDFVFPLLSFFKGVLYPITQVGSSVVDTFLIQAIASIEARVLTATEFEDLLSTEKVARYNTVSATFLNSLRTAITTSNPYLTAGLTELKNSNWSAVYTKYSPSIDPLTGAPEFELFSSEEFTAELNDIITNVETIETTTFETVSVSATNLGESLIDTFEVKVRDNHPRQPLFSDTQTISIIYEVQEDPIPVCGEEISGTLEHFEEYVMIPQNFFVEDTQEKMKIVGFSGGGLLRFKDTTLTPAFFPLVVTRKDILSGELVYTSNTSDVDTLTVLFTTSYEDSYNYCDNNNSFTLTKQAQI